MAAVLFRVWVGWRIFDQVFEGLLVLIRFVVARQLADEFARRVEYERAGKSADSIFGSHLFALRCSFGIDFGANVLRIQISHHLRIGESVTVEAFAPSAPVRVHIDKHILSFELCLVQTRREA